MTYVTKCSTSLKPAQQNCANSLDLTENSDEVKDVFNKSCFIGPSKEDTKNFTFGLLPNSISAASNPASFKAYSFVNDLSQYYLSVDEINFEQKRFNQLPEKEILESDFYKQALTVKAEDLKDKNNLFQIILLANHPSKLVRAPFIEETRFNGSGFDHFLLVPLTECTCGFGIRRPNPPKSKYNMRLLVEEDVLTQIEATFAKDKKIVIGSIGPGGCFQDWMLFSKLILMGYCDLEIHMADPIFKNDDGKRVPAMLDFFNQFRPDVRYDFNFHHSMEECANNLAEKKLDALWAIDWDFPRCRNRYSDRPEPQSVPSFHFSEQGFSFTNKEIPKWELDARMQINRHDEYQKFLI